MARVGHTIRRILSTPPHVTARKAVVVLRRRWQGLWQRQRDRQQASYLADADCLAGPLQRFLRPVPLDVLTPQADVIADLCRHYLDHRFDLLGSGWVRVEHGMRCRGIEGHRYPPTTSPPPSPIEGEGEKLADWVANRINPANRAESQRIWSLIEGPYRPIDWQLDFKSGYRWRESDWYQDIAYGHAPGADVKVPWELARMQHLPQLAWAYALAQGRHAGFAPPNVGQAFQPDRQAGKPDLRGATEPSVYAREFRNQVLDFIATNPPRFGVNWRCPMDVAIRAVNWLVARDLFVAHGMTFDTEFERVFSRSIQEHGRFVMSNLEWDPRLRTNHYLANLAGLLFIAAYLPASRLTDRWLRFARRELVREVALQFLPDGGSFEASTSYHRLAAEMVLYCTALLLGLPASGRTARVRLPSWYGERLQRLAEFTRAGARPDGTVPQIGDNDSGRFLKLEPSYDRLSVGAAKAHYLNLNEYDNLPDAAPCMIERTLDHAHLLAGFDCLFEPGMKATSPETAVLQALLASRRVDPDGTAGGDQPSRSPEARRSPDCGEQPRRSLDDRQGDTVTLQAFPDFGLFFYRSDWLHLVLRCGPVGQHGHGGHAHNDQLSFELAIGGLGLIVDPGTYLYTPLPEQRNRFRSTAMHNALVFPGLEQNGWRDGQQGLFSLQARAQARIIAVRPDLWIGEQHGFGRPCRRSVRIRPRRLDFQEWCTLAGPRYLSLHLAPAARVLALDDDRVRVQIGTLRANLQTTTHQACWKATPDVHSPGYGWLERSLRLELHTTRPQLDWQLEIEDRA